MSAKVGGGGCAMSLQQALIGGENPSVQDVQKHQLYAQRLWLAFVFSCCAPTLAPLLPSSPSRGP